MSYGPGYSAKLWKQLFANINAEIWMAEVDAECIKAYTGSESMKGLNILVGDQENKTTLNSWIQQSKGNFDVIIDDGGHGNNQILTSFAALWPTLNVGGVYFIEDMHVGYHEHWQKNSKEFPPATVVIQSWIESLNIPFRQYADYESHHFHHQKIYKEFPIPKELDWIFCQHTACALHKRERRYFYQTD